MTDIYIPHTCQCKFCGAPADGEPQQEAFDWTQLTNERLARMLESVHPFNTWGSIVNAMREAARRLRATDNGNGGNNG
jgi:hypothetical protein